MIGFFRKIFGPIRAEVRESIPFQGAADWQRLNGEFSSLYLPGFLPSKKITKPVGKVVENGCDFTMNYLNMLIVVPSVTLRQAEDGTIEATYFYKGPWKWAQYYWMGFSLLIFLLGLFVVGTTLFGLLAGGREIESADLWATIILTPIFPLMGLAFIWFASYFRRDLMNKAKTKVTDYIRILEQGEKS